jgi:hypothetical protein
VKYKKQEMGACQATYLLDTTGIGLIADGIATASGTNLHKQNCTKSTNSLIEATNNIISRSITNVISNCDSNVRVEQDVSLKCAPTGPAVYEENATCARCIYNLTLDFKAHNDLEQSLWKHSPAQVRQPIDIMYLNILRDLEACGLTYCKACVLLDVTQQNIINTGNDCISKITNKQSITDNMTNLFQQQFLNNQDVLSAAAQSLGIQGVNKISEHISNSIISNISTSFLDALSVSISNSQVIELTSDTSTQFRNITQNSILNIVEQEVNKNSIATMAMKKELFDNISQIVNNENTLNEVGEVIFKSTVTFAKAIDSSVGKIMFAVLVLLGVITLTIIGYILYRKFKGDVSKAVNIARKRKLNRDKLSAWKEF